VSRFGNAQFAGVSPHPVRIDDRDLPIRRVRIGVQDRGERHIRTFARAQQAERALAGRGVADGLDRDGPNPRLDPRDDGPYVEPV
jgi:hypothetical protein